MTTTTRTDSLVYPTSAADVQAIVRGSRRVLPVGAGTKPALYSRADATCVNLTRLTGIVEYEPGEYTFTAWAGTRLAELRDVLAEHGQSMPFDPPLVEAGATLGGAIAAGLSGSGRYRYGGLRDFILGVRFVDGQGNLVRAGGKVVKNAAGFDLPKLMAGSLGRLGIIVEASFKVFPAPVAYATLRADFASLSAAFAALRPLVQGPYDLEALDLIPGQAGMAVYLRIGGVESALADRLARLATLLGTGDRVPAAEEAAFWAAQREFSWAPADAALVKVATTPNSLPGLATALGEAAAVRRYAVGGNLAWVAWPRPLAGLHDLLTAQGLAGLVFRGAAAAPLIGRDLEWLLTSRIRQALDPDHRFLDYK